MRSPRVGLLGVLLACGLLLGASPIGQAGFLWLHLATADHELSSAASSERHHDDGSTLPHASKHHAHKPNEGGLSSMDDTPESTERSIAPDVPHEHNGNVHTHEQNPGGEPVPLAGAPSKFYLAPAVVPLPFQAPYRSRTPTVVPVPARVDRAVELPPPRLPG